jgi:hypothetical protein
VNLAQPREGILVLLTTLLQACGGGGGGDNGGGGNGDGGRLTVSTTSISVSAEPGEATPTLQIDATIQNPAENLWAYVSSSNNGIQDAWFEWTSSSTAVIHLNFKAPHEIENDRYEDDIQFYVCPDSACNGNISGSPARIHAIYDIEGGTSAGLSANHVESVVDARDEEDHREIVLLDLERPLENPEIEVTTSNNAVAGVHPRRVSATQYEISIGYYLPEYLTQGVHEDLIRLKICYNSDCTKELEGSPLRITSTHEVTIHPEPGFDDLPVVSRVSLGHDVIDAEFSRDLNKIVMVSGAPENALYVYDVATGLEKQQALARLPRAVSIGPDGVTAAVGHDSLISVIDLTTVGQTGAPAPTQLDLSIDVSDVVLDGLGSVHAFPNQYGWGPIRSIAIAAKTEQEGIGGFLQHDSRARLHPAGTAIYEADTISNPSHLNKWDISTGKALFLYGSEYYDIYDFCGNLWFSESGDRIFTACGHIFSVSAVQAEDMQFLDTLELHLVQPESYRFQIRSLSYDAAHDEVALIEATPRCEMTLAGSPCNTHLASYQASTLALGWVFALQPMTIGGTIYPNLGQHVFHDATNGRKYLISHLEGMADQAAAFYLSVVE